MGDNYTLVYQDLLKQLSPLDLTETSVDIGGKMQGSDLEFKCLGSLYRINPRGIRLAHGGDPDVAVGIVICHYILQRGRGEPAGEWVSYRDFRDSAFFMSNFQANVEERLARHFTGRVADLRRAAARLEGRPHKDLPWGDACIRFQALPRVPLLLVFFDGDEEFPATCKLLFDKAASLWLDMECLAALGGILADFLLNRRGRLR